MSDWQERLNEAIKALGIGSAELARRTRFSVQYINSLRNGDRGGRLTHETAEKLSSALAVTVEWLTQGTGRRERVSDVYPIYALVEPAPESAAYSERYPGRAEAIALLATQVAPEVIRALRASVPPDPAIDPGLDFWVARARDLAITHRKIKADPAFAADEASPATEGRPREASASTAPEPAPPSAMGEGPRERAPVSRYESKLKSEPEHAPDAPVTRGRRKGDGLPGATPRKKAAR